MNYPLTSDTGTVKYITEQLNNAHERIREAESTLTFYKEKAERNHRLIAKYEAELALLMEAERRTDAST